MNAKADYAVGKTLLKTPQRYLKVLDDKIKYDTGRGIKKVWIHEMAVGSFLRTQNPTFYESLRAWGERL